MIEIPSYYQDAALFYGWVQEELRDKGLAMDLVVPKIFVLVNPIDTKDSISKQLKNTFGKDHPDLDYDAIAKGVVSNKENSFACNDLDFIVLTDSDDGHFGEELVHNIRFQIDRHAKLSNHKEGELFVPHAPDELLGYLGRYLYRHFKTSNGDARTDDLDSKGFPEAAKSLKKLWNRCDILFSRTASTLAPGWASVHANELLDSNGFIDLARSFAERFSRYDTPDVKKGKYDQHLANLKSSSFKDPTLEKYRTALITDLERGEMASFAKDSLEFLRNEQAYLKKEVLTPYILSLHETLGAEKDALMKVRAMDSFLGDSHALGYLAAMDCNALAVPELLLKKDDELEKEFILPFREAVAKLTDFFNCLPARIKLFKETLPKTIRSYEDSAKSPEPANPIPYSVSLW